MKYLGLLAGVILCAVLVMASLHLRARSVVDGLNAELLQASPPVTRTDLPDLIFAYAMRAGASPEALPHHVRLKQVAEIQMTEESAWLPLEAEQLIAVGEPGFLWEAAQRMGPVTKFQVVDSFVGGEGRLRVDLLGALRVVDAAGSDMDRSEAMRYLAELPWAPDAMLGNPDLHWRALTADRVEVALDMPGGKAAVTFRFDPRGDIVEVVARDRPALGPGGETVLRDWRCILSAYGEVGGRRLPLRGEAGYVVDGVYTPYWRGSIEAWIG